VPTPTNSRLRPPFAPSLRSALSISQESVKLENPTDWQLLVELTGAQDTVATSAAGAQLAAPPKSSPPPSPSAREAKTDESKGTR
jgi:hypothetical protein